jgi:RNA polymerase sigma-70 factor (ECF subfamily)
VAVYDNLGDENLLTLIASGEKDALECFYNRHATAVFSLAKFMLKNEAVAEEVTQEVFLSLWLKASTYNVQRGSPKGWLMSIAHHRVIDHMRSAKRARESTDKMAQEMYNLQALSLVHTEDEAHRNIDRELVVRALDSLPDDQRKVLVMAYFQGFSQSEISEALNQPLGTVKTRMRLGLQKLRAIFENHKDV